MSDEPKRNGSDVWPDENTPVDPPPIQAHVDICRQLNQLSATWTAVAMETSRIQRVFRQARTEIGQEIFGDLARAFEAGRGDLDQTIEMLYIKAAGK